MTELLTPEDKAVLDNILNLEDPTEEDKKWMKERSFSPDRALDTLTSHTVLSSIYTTRKHRYRG